MADGDIPEGIPGPRTLRYFAQGLIILVLLYALGVILSQSYGFTWLEGFSGYFIDNPGLVFQLASLVASFVFLFIVGKLVMEFIESNR